MVTSNTFLQMTNFRQFTDFKALDRFKLKALADNYFSEAQEITFIFEKIETLRVEEKKTFSSIFSFIPIVFKGCPAWGCLTPFPNNSWFLQS